MTAAGSQGAPRAASLGKLSPERSLELVDGTLSESAGVLRTHSWTLRNNVLRQCACQKMRFHTGDCPAQSLERVLRGLDGPSAHSLAYPRVLLEHIHRGLPPPPQRRKQRDQLDARMERFARMPPTTQGLLSLCVLSNGECTPPTLPTHGPLFVQLGSSKPFPHVYREWYVDASTHPW